MDANYALKKLEEYAKYGLAYNKLDLAALTVWVRTVRAAIASKPSNQAITTDALPLEKCECARCRSIEMERRGE